MRTKQLVNFFTPSQESFKFRSLATWHLTESNRIFNVDLYKQELSNYLEVWLSWGFPAGLITFTVGCSQLSEAAVVKTAQ